MAVKEAGEPKDPTSPRCRLSCILARSSTKAIIFRRGPSKQTCLIAWDRSNDTFEIGQWFKGSVYPERCDISADGEWLLIFMANFRAPYGTWTVLSRPPWYTAYALWEEGDTWRGGGIFLGERDIVLRKMSGSKPAIGRVPDQFKVHLSNPEMDERISKALAKSPRPWRSLGGDWRGPFRRQEGETSLTLTWQTESRGWGEERAYVLASGRFSAPLPTVQWADLDQNGDLLFSRGGALYRLPQVEYGALQQQEDILARARCLADFTDMRFQSVKAPYGSSLRGGPGWPGEEEPILDDRFMPPLDRVTKEDRRERKRLRAVRRS